jgi:hypothetical protein
MQTFLPFASFECSAAVLDLKRLRNQTYRECVTLINGGWSNHPASKMWQGYYPALALYSIKLLEELTSRGYHYQKWYDFFNPFLTDHIKWPPWLGDERLHASHRSNLLRKDPEYYGQFGWDEPDNLPYFWPTKEGYDA